MEFRDYWNYTRELIDANLTEWVPRLFRGLSPRHIDLILQILEDGKRLRGCMTCLVGCALDGRIEYAIPRAIAIECIQAASLVHDDYVDGDTVRRRHPAQWTVQGPRKAVLLGDVIFATVIQRMAEFGCRDGMATAQAIATMAQGAYQEFLEPTDLADALTDGRYHRDHYDRVIHMKTGALFGAAARLGAISAAADPRLCELAFQYGARVGEAYQIADDLFDVLHPDGEVDNIAQLALVLLHFMDEADAGRDAWTRPGRKATVDLRRDGIPPVVKERMQEAVGTRVRQALNEAARFPKNDYAPLLRAAPTEIVRMMEPAAI